MTSKSEYNKFKRIYDHGNLIGNANRNIGFNIKLFAVKGMHSEIKKNPDKTKESEVKKLLMALNEEKGHYNCEDLPNSDEYSEFLYNLFANVDDEDRFGDVTLKTSQTFRLVADLIEVLKNWGELSQDWAKKMKYCKFKSIDIAKCLNTGEIPKRGNPNEKNQDDELDQELKNLNNEMINKQQEFPEDKFSIFHNQDMGSANCSSKQYAFKQNQDNYTNIDINYIDKDVNFPSETHDIRSEKPFEFVSSENVNSYGNIQNNKFENINEFENDFDINSVSRIGGDSINTKITSISTSNIKFDSSSPKNMQTISPKNTKCETNLSNLPNQEINLPKNQITSNIPNYINQTNINQNIPKINEGAYPNINVYKPIRTSQVLEKDIKKIEEIVEKKIKPLDTTKFHKKLDFDLPVKFKTPNHYKLQTIILKLMSNAKKDMEANNPDKAKENLELTLYYLTKIEK